MLVVKVVLGRAANGVVSGGWRSIPFRTPEVIAGKGAVRTGVRDRMLPLTLIEVAPGTRVLRDISALSPAVDVCGASELFSSEVASGGFSWIYISLMLRIYLW